MSVKIATAMKTGEVESPSMKLPAMIMAMEVTVKSVSPEGDIASELVITDASVADQPGILPQMAEAMKVSLGNLKGLSANGVTSNSGVNKSTEINAPSGADSQVRNAMEQMKDSFASFSSPLPDEAVGAGAKWEVRLPLKSQGMTIDQTTTYELVSLKDELVSIHFTSNETAPPQKIEDLAMPGVKLDLVKLSGRGSGEVNVNLSQLLPTTGSITSHTDLLVNVGAGARQQSMGKTTDIDLHLEAK